MRNESAGNAFACSFHARLKSILFADAVPLTIDPLKTAGFGVLTDIDVQATMKAKLRIDDRPYRILGACNSSSAHHALTAETAEIDVGLLLPSIITVREEADTSITIGFRNPIALLRVTDEPEVAADAQEVRQRLDLVRQVAQGRRLPSLKSRRLACVSPAGMRRWRPRCISRSVRWLPVPTDAGASASMSWLRRRYWRFWLD